MAKKLYRSVDDRKIAGVCAGLADYLDVDPIVVRLIFLALLLLGVAPIVLIYLAMWLVVPENPAREPKA